MASKSKGKEPKKDGYKLPPIVEWLSFTVDQFKSTANIFAKELQGLLSEFVDENLTDLLREDYKSAKISERVVGEIRDKVRKAALSLQDQQLQAEEELAARFPHLKVKKTSSAFLMNGFKGMDLDEETTEDNIRKVSPPASKGKEMSPVTTASTSKDVSESVVESVSHDDETRPSISDALEDINSSDEEAEEAPKSNALEDINSSDSDEETKSDSEKEEEVVKKSCGASKGSSTPKRRFQEKTTTPPKKSGKDLNEESEKNSSKPSSPALKAVEDSLSPFSDSPMEEDPPVPPEDPQEPSNNEDDDDDHTTLDSDAFDDPEPPPSPTETVALSKRKSKEKEKDDTSKSNKSTPEKSSGKSPEASSKEVSNPPSPTETVFLGPPSKSKSSSKSGDTSKKNERPPSPSDITDSPPCSPPETVFLGRPKRLNAEEERAKKLVLSFLNDDADDDDEDKGGPPSPTETVFIKPGSSKKKVNEKLSAPFKNPKKAKGKKGSDGSESDEEKSDEEKPSSSKPKKTDDHKTVNNSSREMRERILATDEELRKYNGPLKDDPKLKPGVCHVALENIPEVIAERLQTHKFIEIPDKKRSKKSRKRNDDEEDDELLKEIKRLDMFSGILRERKRREGASKSPQKKGKGKKRDSDDDCRDDASTDDSSDGESKRKSSKVLPRKEGKLRKEDMVGSDDEELSGNVSSSSSDEDAAKLSVLKGKKSVKNEPASEDEGKDSDDDKKKKKSSKKGETYYTPAVCRVPDENDSNASNSDEDFVLSKKRKKPVVKTTTIASDSDIQELSSDGSKKKESSSASSDDSSNNKKKNRRKARRHSSSGSDSDIRAVVVKKRRKRVKGFSDSDDSSAGGAKRKRKKPRVETIDSGSDSDVKIDEDEPESKGRKNIRGIISKKDLHRATKEAERAEEERKKRVADRQAQFNGMFEAPKTAVVDSLVLDFDPTTKEPLVSVDPSIVQKLKPHQVDGIRFMWDACFESVEEFKKPNNEGGGCILAHCMGLGKTLQTIAFIHTVMTVPAVKMKTTLVICPLNTVVNWSNELKAWLRDVEEKIYVHKLYDEKSNEARAQALELWQRRGGVGIINYESFRSLVLGARLKKRAKEIIHKTLVDPGPDIVICDEGHVFKNAKSKMAVAVYKIRSKRRVVLTGTPLQNNLGEYHCMMEFVKPKLLGTKKEFQNRFVNPITNGQHKDSTIIDVKVMKKRAHVLHKLLDGCVQRLDYTVLTPYLPPKYEYVLLIRMSDIQNKLYIHYLESIKEGNTLQDLVGGGQMLKHYAHLAKVWCHPYALEMKSAGYNDDIESSEDSIKDFIDDCSDDNSASGSDSDIDWLDEQANIIKNKEKKNKESNGTVKKEGKESGEGSPAAPELSSEIIKNNGDWWSQFFPSKGDMQLIENSSKLQVLFEILKTCEGIQDKVIVFSQFLYSLDIIESFLEELDQQGRDKSSQDTFPPKMNATSSRWRKNIEYFRIDGSTKSSDRQKNCDIFNKNSVSRAKLFLISTKAGGLGINLIGANRVVLFDASWNPSQDMQSIFRVFRFGQTKPCYIYRLLAKGTIEEKVYNRQVVKLSLSGRVVDEHQIERHYTFDDMAKMYEYDPEEKEDLPTPTVPKDRLLADLLISQKDKIYNYHEHDSLLQNQVDQGLSEEERKLAWEEYQNESTLREQNQNRMAQHAEAQSNFLKMQERMKVLFPSESDEHHKVYANFVAQELKSLRNLTNTYYHSKASMTPSLDATWSQNINERKAKIQAYFSNPETLAETCRPQIAQMEELRYRQLMNMNILNGLNQHGARANPPIYVANPGSSNIFEPNFAQYFNPAAGSSSMSNNNVVNNMRTYPSRPGSSGSTSSTVPNLLRRAIPTTTIPYAPSAPAPDPSANPGTNDSSEVVDLD